MRKIICLLIVVCALIFAGCEEAEKAGDNTSVFKDFEDQSILMTTDDTNSSIPENTDTSISYDTDNYENIVECLDQYFSQFISLYTSDAMENSNNNIIIEQKDIFIQSTEGATCTVYKKNDKTIIRAKVNIYGETGKKEINYYFLNETQAVIYIEEIQYSSMVLTINYSDVLYKTIEECYYDGENIYLIDRVSKALLAKEKSCYIDFIDDILT
jgi:hypothetical protein